MVHLPLAFKMTGSSTKSLPCPASVPTCDLAFPVLALNWGWVQDLALRLLPRRFGAALVAVRDSQLALEWWRSGLAGLSTRFPALVDETVRRAETPGENHRQQLEQEILADLEAARQVRVQGEAQVAAELPRL